MFVLRWTGFEREQCRADDGQSVSDGWWNGYGREAIEQPAEDFRKRSASCRGVGQGGCDNRLAQTCGPNVLDARWGLQGAAHQSADLGGGKQAESNTDEGAG